MFLFPIISGTLSLMGIKQRDACAARMSDARRQEFLDEWELASMHGKRAWAIYYEDTGELPKRAGRPKKVKAVAPLPKHLPTNAELFEKFAAWRADVRFKLSCLTEPQDRERVFAPFKPSRDRIRKMFDWARDNGSIEETEVRSKQSGHRQWRVTLEKVTSK